MSEFVGKNFELIKNSPTYQGWLTFVPTYVYDDEYPKDTIIEQSIPAKETVYAGTSIQLKISLGPSKVEIPDHFGLTEKEYIEILDKAGIKYEIIKQPDIGFMTGYVIKTEHDTPETTIDVEKGEILKVFICDNGDGEGLTTDIPFPDSGLDDFGTGW
jgi:serine/threonine-protein kinase